MNINLNITFQIVLIPYVPVVWKLNQLSTFFCPAFVFSNIRQILFNELNAICHNFADLLDQNLNVSKRISYKTFSQVKLLLILVTQLPRSNLNPLNKKFSLSDLITCISIQRNVFTS